MKELDTAVRSRRRGPPKPKDPKKYVSCWTEKDVLEGNVVDAFVMILRNRGCHWARMSGCSMCGYINDTACQGAGSKELLHQFGEILKKYSNQNLSSRKTALSHRKGGNRGCGIFCPVRL